MKKKCLVTGGAGFIGSHTVDALLQQGYAVVVLDILPQSETANLSHVQDKIEYVNGDICDRELLDSVCKKVDFVVHLAAIVSVPHSIEEPYESNRVNAVGTLAVFESAHKNGIKRVVYASSAAVYGDAEVVPVSEEEDCNPQSPYAIQKLMSEMYGKYYSAHVGLETVGLRYFNVFGERQAADSPYSGGIPIFVSFARKKAQPTIFGDGKQTRDFVHVHDVATANILALESEVASGKIYNIATGVERSVNDIFKILDTVLQNAIKPKYKKARSGDIIRSYALTNRAKTELGFVPKKNFEEELTHMAKTSV